MLEANLKAYDRLTLVRSASVLGGSDDDFKRVYDTPISSRKISLGPLNVSKEQVPFSHRSNFSDSLNSEAGRSFLSSSQVPYSAQSYISDIQLSDYFGQNPQSEIV